MSETDHTLGEIEADLKPSPRFHRKGQPGATIIDIVSNYDEYELSDDFDGGDFVRLAACWNRCLGIPTASLNETTYAPPRKGKTATILRELLAWAEKADGIIGDQMDTNSVHVTPDEILRAREHLAELQGDDDATI